MSNVRENLPQAITGAITEVREKERKEGVREGGRGRESINNNIIIVVIIITVLGCILVSRLILLDILFCS